jgi:putative ABC transport system permease protein
MRSARWAKVRGDLRAARGRVALMIVAVAVSLSAVGVVLGAFGIAGPELDRNYRETRPASATLEVAGADGALAADVRALPGVVDAEARGAVLTRVKSGADWLPFLLFVVDDFADLRLNTFRREAGAWLPPDGTVLLERTAVVMLGAPVGSALTLKAPHGPPTRVVVSGSVHDPGLAPAWQERTGYGYATRATLRALGEAPVMDELRIAVADGGDVAAIARSVAAWLGVQGRVVHEIRIPPAGRHPHAGQMTALLFMMATFSVLGLGLSSILVAATLAALLARQVREIGVLKALGASRRQVAALYLAVALFVAAVSLVIAIPAGMAGAQAFAALVAGLLNFTLEDARVPTWALAVQIAAGLTVPVLAAAVPVVRAARITVRQALDDDGGLRAGGRASRIAGRVRGDRRIALTLRNTTRRPARLALVLGLLAAGGAMFLTARGVEAGWGRMVDQVYATRHYDVELRLVQEQPSAAVAARLGAVPGVRLIETWGRAPAAFAVPGQLDVVRTYPDAGHGSVTAFGVPAGSRVVEFPLLAGRWLEAGDDGVVVLNHSARRQSGGVGVGDTVLISFDGRPARLRVVGVVQEVGAAAAAYVTDGTFARVTGSHGTTRFLRIVTSARGPAERTAAIRAVERELAGADIAVESAVPLSELRTAMGEHVVVLVRMLQSMALLFALVGALGLASAMSAAVIERRRELGVLRAIGGAPRTVLGLVVGEGVVIGALSWLFAVALAVPLALTVGRIVGELGFGTPLALSLSVSSMLAWLGLVMLGGGAASVIPAWQASRRPVHESLVRP